MQSIGLEFTLLNNIGLQWRSALSISGGGAISHEEHAHAHQHEEHDDHLAFEAEAAIFDNYIITGNWLVQFQYNDYHRWQTTLASAWGENEFSKNTQLYGLGLEYQWRKNGFEPGGKYFHWRTEAMFRQFDTNLNHNHAEENKHEEEEEHSETDFEEFGIYSLLGFGINKNLEIYLRGEFISGISSADLDERYRISPGITLFLNKTRNAHIRLQYNYDQSNNFGTEHSAWLQFGFNWGGAEVR